MKNSQARVRQARQNAKLSQQALGALVGVHRSAVAQWEKIGGSNPTVENLARIALSTSVQFEWLATGRGRMKFSSDLTGSDKDAAILLEYAAHNEVEARGLAAFRKIANVDVIAVVEMLEALARTRAVKLKRAIAYSK